MPLLRFLFAALYSLGLAAVLWTQTGPFEWLGRAQLAFFGRYSVKLTLVLTILILLAPGLLLRAVLIRRNSAGLTSRSRVDRASLLGVFAAAAAVLALGLMPVIAPRPAVTGSLHGLPAKAGFVPAPASLRQSAEAESVDVENSVNVTMHRHSPAGTVYAPVHTAGSTEVTAFVSGTELDWRNANIQALPFPNEANAAAVARAGDAILSLQPVPFLVRREWAQKGMPVPPVLPALQWGRNPLSANVPLLTGGGTVLLLSGIALLRRPRPALPAGKPPDM